MVFAGFSLWLTVAAVGASVLNEVVNVRSGKTVSPLPQDTGLLAFSGPLARPTVAFMGKPSTVVGVVVDVQRVE